ncbi:MAG: AI-2E family transporter [Candidatus Nanopelagicales bacterium]|nr:AI-2E family transporter [Candidatus Nanopelagicales bacterium]MDP4824311.1 AI-2E family transporter [Candidatus Nanopelagicales bacterium]MDP4888983.1 AI-2E family transporter [Candidatus Nanopelagicales bacterium]
MTRKDRIVMRHRPSPPEPYDTPDQVSPQMRRVGGYAWRLTAIGVVGFGILLLFEPVQALALAIFFGLLVAAWLMPLTNLMDRVMPRGLAATLSILFFSVCVGLVIAFIGLSTASQWDGIADAFRQGVLDLEQWLQEGPFAVSDTQLTQAYDWVVGFIQDSGGAIALGVLSGLGSVLGIGTAVAGGFFVLIFALAQPERLMHWFVQWMPSRNRVVIGDSIRIAWEGFSQYSRGVVLVAITNAAVVTVVLLIMGVPLAIPLGIIVFFGAFIPYIGAPIAMFLAAFVALVTNGPLAGALVIALIFIIGQLEGNVLHPLIMGRTVDLHPLAIVLVTAAGAAYFGLIGALIGVPLAAGVYGVLKYLRGDAIVIDDDIEDNAVIVNADHQDRVDKQNTED